jgi:hypothetical protein
MNNNSASYNCLVPAIRKMAHRGLSVGEISRVLGIARSTVKRLLCTVIAKSIIDKIIGKPNNEYLRVAAIHRLCELLTIRGWAVIETEAKAVFDVLAYKDGSILRIQSRSSAILSARGWPTFKTSRLLFNTKRIKRCCFKPDDFDLWFFYHKTGDCWLVPFDVVTHRSAISSENLDQFRVLPHCVVLPIAK